MVALVCRLHEAPRSATILSYHGGEVDRIRTDRRSDHHVAITEDSVHQCFAPAALPVSLQTSVRLGGLEPPRLSAQDSQSCKSTNSITDAVMLVGDDPTIFSLYGGSAVSAWLTASVKSEGVEPSNLITRGRNRGDLPPIRQRLYQFA